MVTALKNRPIYNVIETVSVKTVGYTSSKDNRFDRIDDLCYEALTMSELFRLNSCQ